MSPGVSVQMLRTLSWGEWVPGPGTHISNSMKSPGASPLVSLGVWGFLSPFSASECFEKIDPCRGFQTQAGLLFPSSPALGPHKP